jgi:RNA polymerase sigma-70 factor (ECF subfamily)
MWHVANARWLFHRLLLQALTGAYTDEMAASDTHDAAEIHHPGGALAVLLENHRSFLSYLTRRVGDRALAEDILQDAFVRNMPRLDDLPEEAAVPWFYRILRNAAIDHYRRQQTKTKALAQFAKEVEAAETPQDELHSEICACVNRLADTLKPDYAEALKAIDVDGTTVKAFAGRKGLTAGNAGVRVFRAREALRKLVVSSCGVCAEHGCMHCTCAPPRR